MNEPRRLLDDDATDVERELLRAGRAYRPPRALRRRTLAALGLSGALSTGGVAVAMQSLKVVLTAKGWITVVAWTCIAVGAGALTLGPRLAPSRGPDTSAVVAAPVPSAPFTSPMEPRLPPEPGAEPAPEAPPPPVASAEPTLPSRAAPPAKPLGVGPSRETALPEAPAPPAAPSAEPSSSLAEELSLVDEARQAVRAHDAARALAAIDAHHRRFPRGKLGLEVTVLHIEALIAQGNRAAARSLGASFLAAHPNHVLSERVRALLGNDAEKQPR